MPGLSTRLETKVPPGFPERKPQLGISKIRLSELAGVRAAVGSVYDLTVMTGDAGTGCAHSPWAFRFASASASASILARRV
jgi:hypothetical protein